MRFTGLCIPCVHLDLYQKRADQGGLDSDAQGKLILKSGVIAIVVASGTRNPGDAIAFELPSESNEAIEAV